MANNHACMHAYTRELFAVRLGLSESVLLYIVRFSGGTGLPGTLLLLLQSFLEEINQ